MSKILIITTGDISDVDGFLAFAEYVKNSDADILFILNYPAFLKNFYYKKTENSYLGFGFGLKTYLHNLSTKDNDIYTKVLKELETTTEILNAIDTEQRSQKITELYNKLLNKSDKTDSEISKIEKELNINRNQLKLNQSISKQIIELEVNAKYNLIENFKKLYLKFTKFILEKIYNEIIKSKNTRKILIYSSKFTHTVNAFSISTVKYEFIKYKNQFNEMIEATKAEAAEATTITEINYISDCELLSYDSIYIDGNGSFSFFSTVIQKWLQTSASKIKGCFIQGGVLANIVPQTIACTPEIIHRCGLSTMNQLYHINGFMQFMDFCATNTLNILFVPNNCILASDNLINQLKENYLNHSFTLMDLCNSYYKEGGRKPFDLVTAKFMTNAIEKKINYFTDEKKSKFIFSEPYGISLLCSSLLETDKLEHLHDNHFYYETIIRSSKLKDSEKYKISKYYDTNKKVKIYDCFIGYTNTLTNYSDIICEVVTYDKICDILGQTKTDVTDYMFNFLLERTPEKTKQDISKKLSRKTPEKTQQDILKTLLTLYIDTLKSKTGGYIKRKKIVRKIKRHQKY